MVKEFVAIFTITDNPGTEADFRLEPREEASVEFKMEESTMEANFSIEKGSGDKHFTFEQGLSSSVWTIEHPLKKKASVTVVDEYDRIIECQVEYISDSKVIVTLNYPMKGWAYLN